MQTPLMPQKIPKGPQEVSLRSSAFTAEEATPFLVSPLESWHLEELVVGSPPGCEVHKHLCSRVRDVHWLRPLTLARHHSNVRELIYDRRSSWEGAQNRQAIPLSGEFGKGQKGHHVS